MPGAEYDRSFPEAVQEISQTVEPDEEFLVFFSSLQDRGDDLI